MATASDHARAIFSAIVPDRRDLLETVLTELSEEHFPTDGDARWAAFFRMFKWYYEFNSEVLSKHTIEGITKELPSSESHKKVLFETTYDTLEAQHVSDADFKWALYQLKQIYATNTTKAVLAQGVTIITKGVEDSKGNELKGHEAAREYVMAQLGVIDQRLTVQEAPDADVREEEEEFLQEYESRKTSHQAGEYSGIEFGIPKLDQMLGGLQPGELDLILGYASAGKSSLCCQLSWNAAVMQRKNVVYVTTETIRTQIRRKLISRHSRLSKFGIEEGLNSLNLKRGDLTPHEEEKLKEVMHDFSHNESYGKLRVMQASDSLTVTSLNVRLQAIQREFPIDLVVVDALYILKPEVRRKTEREELNEKIQQAMVLSKTFNNGAGIPLVSPWQASRAAKEKAEREKQYDMSALAETAYAERFTDNVVGLLEPPGVQGRYKTLSVSGVKVRDGERYSNFDVDADYATCYFADSGHVQQAAHNALIGLNLGL